MKKRAEEIARLWRQRPKNKLARWSIFVMILIVAYAWFCGEIKIVDLFSATRMENLHRFLTVDIIPYSLRNGDGNVWKWISSISERGLPGLFITVAMSVIAMVIAGAIAFFLCLPAARTFMTSDPFSIAQRRKKLTPRIFLFQAGMSLTRFLFLFMRSIPEYVWAYLFLAMLGPSAWPAILALAIHNGGIMGKLGSETIENLEPSSLNPLRALGATRLQIATSAIFPLALPRFLLYFFYRFETCLREATVLGMLGIVSLGYWIADARGKQFYDEMFFLTILAGVVVVLGDMISSVARRVVREA